MNKYFSLALVGVLSLGLATSCGKKKDEPIDPVSPVNPVQPVDPNGNNNAGGSGGNSNGGSSNGTGSNDNGGGTSTNTKPSAIMLVLSDNATEFTVSKVVGTDLKITGANESKLVAGKITSSGGGTVQISGKIDTLILTGANFKSTDFSAADGLRYLRMDGYTGTTTNVSGATNLSTLIINVSSNNTNIGVIDVAKMSSLRTLVLNGGQSTYGNSASSIILPEQSVLANLDLFMIGVNAFTNFSLQTKLIRLVMYGRPYSTKEVYDLTANTELEEMFFGRMGGGGQSFNLGNKPKLRSIYNHNGEVLFGDVLITSAPLLSDYNGAQAYTYRRYRSLQGLEGIRGRMNAKNKLQINGTAITKVLKAADNVWSSGEAKILDLKDNKITTANLSGYSNIVEVHLQGNNLSSEAITSLIATLPTRTGNTAKIYLNKASGETNAIVTDAQKSELAKKGWTLTTP